MMPKRILVTGGAGFIGSHSVDWLLRENCEVVILDNLSSGHLSNLDLRHPRLELVEGDILEYPLVASLIKNCDAVLHLAAIASVPQSIAEPIYTFQVNTQGFLHILTAAHQVNPKARIVYASSAAVYGDQPQLPCNDAQPLTTPALSPYALQKMHNEAYADLFTRLYGLQCLGLRYFNVYGERQLPTSPYAGVISRFFAAYAADETVTIFGDGSQSRDYIYVAEVARANGLALGSDYQGVLNIATGVPQTLLQLIAHIASLGGRPVKQQFSAARHGDIQASYGTTQLAAHHLAFKAEVSLADGLGQMHKSGMIGPVS